MNMLESNTNVM